MYVLIHTTYIYTYKHTFNRYFIDRVGGRGDWNARAKTRMWWAAASVGVVSGVPMLFQGTETLQPAWWHLDKKFRWDLVPRSDGEVLSCMCVCVYIYIYIYAHTYGMYKFKCWCVWSLWYETLQPAWWHLDKKFRWDLAPGSDGEVLDCVCVYMCVCVYIYIYICVYVICII